MGNKKDDTPQWVLNKRKYILEYNKTHKKRISLDVHKSYYENVLKPAADKVGQPVITFVRQAINDRIEREHLCPTYYTADRATHVIIESFLDIEDARKAILKYYNEPSKYCIIDQDDHVIE